MKATIEVEQLFKALTPRISRCSETLHVTAIEKISKGLRNINASKPQVSALLEALTAKIPSSSYVEDQKILNGIINDLDHMPSSAKSREIANLKARLQECIKVSPSLNTTKNRSAITPHSSNYNVRIGMKRKREEDNHSEDHRNEKRRIISQLSVAGRSKQPLRRETLNDTIWVLTHEQLTPKEYTIILLGYAKSTTYGKKEFLEAWEASAITAIGTFNAQNLSNSLYVYGKLGIQPSTRFLQVWEERAITAIGTFNTQDLSNSLYAYGKLDIKPSNEFLQAWEKRAITAIGRFNAQELSNSLYAYGKLGIKPSEAFLQAWEKRAITAIGTFNTQDLSNSLYAYGKLGIEPSEAFRQAWEARAITTIGRFNEQDLSNSLYAYGQLGIEPSKAFLRAWEASAITAIGTFNAQDLSNSLYAYGQLGIEPSTRFLQAWEASAITAIGRFNAQGLSNSLYAYGKYSNRQI